MDQDVYFVDTRNADVRDHRVPTTATVVRGPASTVLTPAATRVAYAPSPVTYAPPSQQAVMYPGQFGSQFAPQWFGQGPVYSPGPSGMPWTSQLGGMFGGLGLGDVIKLAADAFAAFKSLPPAPAPTGDVATDVANNVVYMSALAKDASDRKKLEFGGELAGGLTGRLGYGWGPGAR